jgi:hypothetical protein
VLKEWLETDDPARVEAAAALLREAPSLFVFQHSDLVVDLLDRADGLGDECYRHVGAHLYASATCTMKQGVAGQPFPQDIQLRDRADDALRTVPAGSPAARLFESLRRTAEREISNSLLEAEEAD